MNRRIAKRTGRVMLEVCVETAAGAAAAVDGGADRIELATALDIGGTTPSAGLIGTVRALAPRPFPLVVLIRPRGGDFLYDSGEFACMQTDVRIAKELGADGVATGILCSDGTVDLDRMAELVVLARPMTVTFHRAFDMVSDQLGELERLVTLGCERVLTSGGARTVPEGCEVLGALVQAADGRIRIMPGGGVTEDTLAEVLRRTGARDVHVSASGSAPSAMLQRNPACQLGSSGARPEFQLRITDPERVAAFAQIVRKA